MTEHEGRVVDSREPEVPPEREALALKILHMLFDAYDKIERLVEIAPAQEPSEAEWLLREIHENRTMRNYDSSMHDRIGQHLDALSAARRARDQTEKGD